MPDLNFRIAGVEAVTRGLVPLLHFTVEVTNAPATQQIHSAMLHVQIQLESARRSYSAEEKEKLSDLFGTPERWGQTLRTRLWTLTSTTLRSFAGTTEAIISVPCTFDLNVSATKYFHGLAGGEVPLLFLFSGTVFYAAEDGRLQVHQISWEKECAYRMPVSVWQELMDHHYPNSAWVPLARETFERLCAYRRESGFTDWETTIASLLAHPPAEQLAVPDLEVGP